MSVSKFRANGKLLLFGEYFVMDGALALAVPTRAGQSLEVVKSEFANEETLISWTSLDPEGKPWFTGKFNSKLGVIESSNAVIAEALKNLLLKAHELNSDFPHGQYIEVITKLEFPLQWGLGSSSTLISNLALWAEIDPYKLFFAAFKGSGYDVACASARQPVFYQLTNGEPYCESADFRPPFIDNLYFVYLNRKKNSREAITLYDKKKVITADVIDKITSISKRATITQSQEEFAQLMREHEAIVSSKLCMFNVQDLYFRDFLGTIKSLGAWGGDFIMVLSAQEPAYVQQYFKKKGFNTVLPYRQLVLDSQAIEHG